MTDFIPHMMATDTNGRAAFKDTSISTGVQASKTPDPPRLVSVPSRAYHLFNRIGLTPPDVGPFEVADLNKRLEGQDIAVAMIAALRLGLQLVGDTAVSLGIAVFLYDIATSIAISGMFFVFRRRPVSGERGQTCRDFSIAAVTPFELMSRHSARRTPLG